MKNFLIKYNFIKIVPFEDTFYHTSVLPKNLKFSKELLKLNYAKYSPFKNPNILSHYSSQTGMIWFCDKAFDSLFVVPQSFVLYSELKKQKEDAIYVIDDESIKVLVIKDGKLLNAFVVDALDDALELSINEYQISNIKQINKNQYKNLCDIALRNLALKDIYSFSQYDLDIKSISKNLVSKLSYPLCALIIFSILLNYSHGIFLDKEIGALKANYLEQKNQNQKLKNAIRKHNNKIKRYENFIQKELIYPSNSSLLEEVYKVFKPNEKANIKDVLISNGKMTLRLQTNINPVVFLNRLSQRKYLQNVIISASFKPKNAPKIVTYDIDIMPLRKKDGL